MTWSLHLTTTLPHIVTPTSTSNSHSLTLTLTLSLSPGCTLPQAACMSGTNRTRSLLMVELRPDADAEDDVIVIDAQAVEQ